jgi:transposase
MVAGRKQEGEFSMPQTHPPYPPEYRRWIVELARAGRSINELAREFEPSANDIRKWVKQAGLDDGLRSDGLTTDERAQLNRLRRENRVLREEREILAKPRPGSRRRPARCRHGVPIRERESGHQGLEHPWSSIANHARIEQSEIQRSELSQFHWNWDDR